MKSSYAVIAFVIVFAVFLTVLRQFKGDVATLAACFICISLLALSVNAVIPVAEYVSTFTGLYEHSEHISIIMKAVGTAVICTAASEICRDSGESALAYGVETFCKCEIVVMSFPLIKSIMGLVTEILK